MKIDVTEEDIKKGRRGSLCNCPVALALSKHLTFDKDEVFVSCDKYKEQNGYAEIYTKFFSGMINLGKEVGQKIIDFDNGLPIAPFSFDLPLPENFLN